MSVPRNGIPHPQSVLDAAHEYFKRGWSVVPFRTNKEVPRLTNWREYRMRALNLPDLIALLAERPNANIGVVTGRISGITVIDFDGVHAPDAAKHAGISLPKTLTHRTPYAGFHYFIRYDPRLRTGTRFVTAGDECDCTNGGEPTKCTVDVQNDGATTILPPSGYGRKRYRVAREAPIMPWVNPPDYLFTSG